MDRQHRRELKHDKFVDEIGVLSSAARQNQRILITIGAAVLLLAVAGYGFFWYRDSQEKKAQDLLAAGIDTIESPVGTPNQTASNPDIKFKTAEERNAAAEKQFKDVKAKYGSSDAAAVADLYIARLATARGDTTGARALLQKFVSGHPDQLLVGTARYSLYQMRIDAGEAQAVAQEIQSELTKKDPVLPADSLLVLLAHAYDVQGNEQKSRDAYRRIVTEFPDSPFALEAQRRVGPA
jgi:TolA-binding protein